MTQSAAVTGSAWGLGLATIDDEDRRVLDVAYRTLQLGASDVPSGTAAGTQPISAAQASELGGQAFAAAAGPDALRGVTLFPVITLIADLGDAPATVEDAYLRLHLLSHRLVAPNTINLDGLFGVLPNNAWTTLGPVNPTRLDDVRLRCRAAGRPFAVTSVDKFPRMTDYVVPAGVRIADADRVRLGAHLADGTTVMHEGFVNFNAGTLGHSMVEGRISQGVVIGDGTDLGGGCSIMGTLSGGGSEVIALGEGCLLGANAGLGISLGDGCIVEAGLYVTGGTIVQTPDGQHVKARELSGADRLLFRRNSVSGGVEVLPASGTWQGLNAALHAN